MSSVVHLLQLLCTPEQVDQLSAELWEQGTTGIEEIDEESGVCLVAAFPDDGLRQRLCSIFQSFQPVWREEVDRDWVEAVKQQWPPRPAGSRFVIAPPWHTGEVAPERLRLIQNPGTACGTGEHPCTQLALEALEALVQPGDFVVDIGTGSGILCVAALALGARGAIGVDIDPEALATAALNHRLNGCEATLFAGSAEAIRSDTADATVANISGTVLLALQTDLLRITKPGGWLVLTGFVASELPRLAAVLQVERSAERDGWCCVAAKRPY